SSGRAARKRARFTDARSEIRHAGSSLLDLAFARLTPMPVLLIVFSALHFADNDGGARSIPMSGRLQDPPCNRPHPPLRQRASQKEAVPTPRPGRHRAPALQHVRSTVQSKPLSSCRQDAFSCWLPSVFA